MLYIPPLTFLNRLSTVLYRIFCCKPIRTNGLALRAKEYFQKFTTLLQEWSGWGQGGPTELTVQSVLIMPRTMTASAPVPVLVALYFTSHFCSNDTGRNSDNTVTQHHG